MAQEVFEKVNQWKPDFVAITGDFIDYPALACIELGGRLVEMLEAPCWHAVGNHDWWEMDPPGREHWFTRLNAAWGPQPLDWFLQRFAGVNLLFLDGGSAQGVALTGGANQESGRDWPALPGFHARSVVHSLLGRGSRAHAGGQTVLMSCPERDQSEPSRKDRIASTEEFGELMRESKCPCLVRRPLACQSRRRNRRRTVAVRRGCRLPRPVATGTGRAGYLIAISQQHVEKTLRHTPHGRLNRPTQGDNRLINPREIRSGVRRSLNRRVLWTAVVVAMAPRGGLLCGAETSVPAAATWRPGTPIVTYYAGPGFDESTPLTDASRPADGRRGYQPRLVAYGTGTRGGTAARLASAASQWVASPKSLDNPVERAELDALVARVRQHPALFSYHIQDEPCATEFPGLGRIVDYLREHDPQRLAYINLFPIYAKNEELGTQGDAVTAYREHHPAIS